MSPSPGPTTPECDVPRRNGLPTPPPEWRVAALPDRFRGWTLTEVIDHLRDRYHTPLLREMARIHASLREMRASFSGERLEHVEDLVLRYAAFREEVETHLFKEEVALFPALHRGRRRIPLGAIFLMDLEHRHGDEALDRLVRLAESCPPPDEGLGGWGRIVQSLRDLADFQAAHQEFETTVLIPVALGGE